MTDYLSGVTVRDCAAAALGLGVGFLVSLAACWIRVVIVQVEVKRNDP